MDIQGIAAIVFILLMGLFLYINRKKISMQSVFFPLLYFVMLKTKIGLKTMNSIAKTFPRALKWLGTAGFIIGFLGMGLICYELVKNTYFLLISPEVASGVQPVLPFEAKGVFFVPFIYWILSIFVIAVVHEFSHGIMARAYGLKIKSSGLAFLGIIIPLVPAAFVEPDEKKLSKKSARAQLAVYAAGPFANILLAGIVILLIMYVATPISKEAFEPMGIKLVGITSDGPFDAAGITEDEILTGINGVPIVLVKDLTDTLEKFKPDERVIVRTDRNSYVVEIGANPKDATKPYLGINTRQFNVAKPTFVEKYGAFVPDAIKWIVGLLYWLFILNLGIGLFNLMPIGPIDGGRMLNLVCRKIHAKKGAKVFKLVSIFFLMIVLFNVVAGFI